MSPKWGAAQRRPVLILAAAMIAAAVLVALPALLGSEPSSGVTSDGGAPSLGEAGSQGQDAPLPEDAVVPGEMPGGLRAFAVTDLPDGFRVDRNEFQDQPNTRADRVYMAFVRSEDPDASADWAIIRVRVLYSPFDANAWYDAYMKPEPAEESGRIPNVELTSVGNNANALIEYPHPGQDAGLVLRFGNNDVQIMLTTTPGVTEAELRRVAEGIVEVSR
jgi:hypothetical protein